MGSEDVEAIVTGSRGSTQPECMHLSVHKLGARLMVTVLQRGWKLAPLWSEDHKQIYVRQTFDLDVVVVSLRLGYSGQAEPRSACEFDLP
jgi:hypothetical protein